ncbi:MAG: hypothetical protein WEB78_07430, partial [Ilumatobacteraceae bacterium]
VLTVDEVPERSHVPRVDLPDDRAQDETALRSSNPGIGLEPADERVEPRCTRAVDDDRVIALAGDVGGERDLVAPGEQALERFGINARRETDVDHCPDRPAEGGGIDLHGVAAHEPALLEPTDSIGHRTRRQVHTLGELAPTHPSVLTKRIDDLSVDSVDCHCFIGHQHSVTAKEPLINGSTRQIMGP